MFKNATEALPEIRHAGAIFIGNYSPEPLGDYLAGPNHTLPTSGTAKFASPLGVYDFTKKSSIIRYSKEALEEASQSIIEIASKEGLTGHAESIRSEEHTSELQSRGHLVCRLMLEKTNRDRRTTWCSSN